MPKTFKSLSTSQYKSSKKIDGLSTVIVEQPVTLYVNGKSWLTFMCTPKDLKELAAGFLFNEGVIQSKTEIKVIEVGKNDQHIDIWLNRTIDEPKNWRRTSGCAGGYTSAIIEEIEPVELSSINISADQILELFRILLQNQESYKEVGGVHSSALSDGKSLIYIPEDVGRHNTIDKISGKILLDDIEISPIILLTTGRLSSEMIQKAARMKSSIVVSRTSPTTLSIEIAESLGVTVIGYARGKKLTVYTYPERINFN
ncbi:MAG: formate dehydrogenase accessory sulfurtransferase FdhD [Chloroflexi bacterium]|jgi:FdhD protein|nr:formate dehydrogenase accessory sulfurtransferase FdhD [Chloroflexota bacterium]MBT4003372.1 formate dehydrogenase accessory sulfurtransferase FdhD [Chloroflexota bacterium]MBT4305933.1 formate dehydrogenase accessory sulfurtransferase FdhD [Chloroflexota bacterium]MBT4533758.1 formate dehydrogenase accessory sulfurtransferase FdhD [Chloroflexota bacterium]MBT4681598.1 formate dehydrogenase accessory sulfurtransferase FdhD [Chloroflexota bacterium]